MSTTLQKTEVKTTWPVTKIQEEVAASMMRNMALTFKVVEKAGPQVLKDWYQAFTTMKVDYYRQQGAKTPVDLVRIMSEFETNLFGSKIRFWGDDKQAGLEYEVCGCWNAMGKAGVTEADFEKMSASCAESMNHLAKEFGFTVEMKKGEKPSEPCFAMTFTRQ